ncbi:unnamed protein product, partial [Leptosia nina]
CECEHRRLTSLVWWSCSVAEYEVLGVLMMRPVPMDV